MKYLSFGKRLREIFEKYTQQIKIRTAQMKFVSEVHVRAS
jgi:hypothetical protein